MAAPGPVPTRGEQMLALRKRRMAATHPVLRGGFRPFFLGAAAWGLGAMLLWLGVVAGPVTLPSRFEPVAWHRHEMLFGFVGAAVAGFLLTAIPNWTGRLPIAGRPLLSLFLLWAVARLAVLASASLGLWPAAIVDVGLFVVLGVLAAREVLASGSRNLPIVGLVLLFGLADALDYLEVAGLVSGGAGWRGAIVLVTLMIALVGGRIIPSFTRNWMGRQGLQAGLPTQPGGLDRVIIAATAAALLFWLAVPGDSRTGAMLVLAALAQVLRLARWSGWRTTADPLVLVLHLGYLWLPAGLLLLGLATAGVPASAGIHALTAGAMTTMILAVMTRASLGHTARALRAAPPTVAAYGAVTIGAVLRVGVALGLGDGALMLELAGACWALALALFLWVYGPVLWRPRLGDAA